MIDGKVYVHHMHIEAQRLAGTPFVQGRDLYGRVRLDAAGKVMVTRNMDTPLFTVADFLATNRPWDYMVSSSLSDPTWTPPRQELLKLRDAINDLDESHLVYALVLAEGYAPELFAEDAARLLAHPSMSVRIKAYRVLRAVPTDHLSDGLEGAVNKGLAECPERAEFADALLRN